MRLLNLKPQEMQGLRLLLGAAMTAAGAASAGQRLVQDHAAAVPAVPVPPAADISLEFGQLGGVVSEHSPAVALDWWVKEDKTCEC
eukprot:SAG22_NODE_1113_length_5533_cov_5.884063_9_plen_86_part_00